jgi:hypothetical protein
VACALGFWLGFMVDEEINRPTGERKRVLELEIYYSLSEVNFIVSPLAAYAKNSY